MNTDQFLENFARSGNVRAWAIMKALAECRAGNSDAYNELACLSLVYQHHDHPNKKRWSAIYKMFLMPRNGTAKAKAVNLQVPINRNSVDFAYLADPRMLNSPARTAVRDQYANEVFPDLMKTFEKGDITKGRKAKGFFGSLGTKLTSYKRKVGGGDFDAVVAEFCRAGGPIDGFAQSIASLPPIGAVTSGEEAMRLRLGVYNAGHGAVTAGTQEHWLRNLQAVLPQYDIDLGAAGLDFPTPFDN